MAHHSSEPFSELPPGLKEAFKERGGAGVDLLGATGQYPQGRYTPQDEGELQFAIAGDKQAGKVIVSFGKPVAWFGMDADQADGLAELLKRKAAEVRLATGASKS